MALEEMAAIGPRRRALLDELGGGPTLGGPRTGAPMGPAVPRAPGTFSAANPAGGSVGALRPSAGAAPAPPTPFAGDPRGFLMDSLTQFAPQVRAVTGQDDSVRKKMVEDHLRSLLPELSSRGLNVGDVRGEKINVGGQWIDLLQDVANGQGGGAAIPQWLVEEAGGGAPMGGMGGGNAGILSAMGGLDALLQGNPTQGIQQALQQINQRPNFEALMAQLNAR